MSHETICKNVQTELMTIFDVSRHTFPSCGGDWKCENVILKNRTNRFNIYRLGGREMRYEHDNGTSFSFGVQFS